LKERARLIQVFLDSKDGVSLDDCAEMSRRISEMFRRHDLFQDYNLEVSSPGIGREIHNDNDLARNIGRFVKVLLDPEEESNQAIRGYLESFDSESVRISTEKGLVPVQKSRIEKITGDVDFKNRGFQRGKEK